MNADTILSWFFMKGRCQEKSIIQNDFELRGPAAFQSEWTEWKDRQRKACRRVGWGEQQNETCLWRKFRIKSKKETEFRISIPRKGGSRGECWKHSCVNAQGNGYPRNVKWLIRKNGFIVPCKLKGISRGQHVQSCAQIMISWNRLLRTLCNQVFLCLQGRRSHSTRRSLSGLLSH